MKLVLAIPGLLTSSVRAAQTWLDVAPEDVADIEIKSNSVEYATLSGLGWYTITDNNIVFEGRRNSLIAGCPLIKIVPCYEVYDSQHARCGEEYLFFDCYIYARPVSWAGPAQVSYRRCDAPDYAITTSKPDQRLVATN